MWLRILVALTVVYATKKIIAFWQVARGVDNLPGYRGLFTAYSFLNYLGVPKIAGVVQGSNYLFNDKHTPFASAGCDVVAHVSAYPCRADILLADAAVIKEVTSSRARFPKPVENYAALSFFGFNIVASEGEIWKKYRKITAPAFSDRNNKLVWDETIGIMNDLFNNVWGSKEVITVDHCRDVTLPIALFVIGIAGFGREMTWREDSSIPPGHQMTFKDSLSIVSTHLLQRILVADWVMNLTAKTREIKLGFEELKLYMLEMIEQRMNSEKVERHDLFSSLLEANNDEGGALSSEELIGNIFIFLLAGHETTAHTLCFCFALLALYPDEQEKLYQHIKSVLPDLRTPTYEEMPLLTQSIAVFYETLRMYPPAPNVPKRAAEDTTLSTTNAQGETVTIPLPKGTNLMISLPGLHYNPKYWEDPHMFKPDRFTKPGWDRDAFLPFSGGARACLGRKFFETEGIAALTMLVSRYKITIKEEPQFAHETLEQKMERVMRNKPSLTLTPIRCPLVFTRRS
ncbi:cytochrome P450 [Macrolepiota fuliginosa MF-IS2]|uniref:Cytochrome P450 n=1 Tax=Macrolepiota fuliginosa MF-IS2 TaxID=1400762 RepID=A0A9P5XKH2_9AGAR|nr:cytochrome P450 [Macrolepiota fuliginosa MF-IS2]